MSAVADGLGLSADDSRGLTVTGGPPFFGGAGNNYSMHAIAETVALLRATPGAYGMPDAAAPRLASGWCHHRRSQQHQPAGRLCPQSLGNHRAFRRLPGTLRAH